MDSHHLEEIDINREGDLIITVLPSHLQAGRNINREGDLQSELPSHLQEEEVIDLEVPLLGDTKAQEEEDTTGHQVAQCGEDHQHLETLHSNKTVYVVVNHI